MANWVESLPNETGSKVNEFKEHYRSIISGGYNLQRLIPIVSLKHGRTSLECPEANRDPSRRFASLVYMAKLPPLGVSSVEVLW